jgi:hypothetical protein
MDEAAEQLRKLAEEHPDQVDAAIDKGAQELEERTGGKYTDQIEGGAEKAKEALDADDKHGDKHGDGPGEGRREGRREGHRDGHGEGRRQGGGR